MSAPLYSVGLPGGQEPVVHWYRLLPPYVLYASQVSSSTWNRMFEVLASLRTTNGIRLPLLLPPPSSRTRWATYKPDTAVDGTAHWADTAQLPQSMSPVGPGLPGVVGLSRQAGWVCGS